jgi:hypothetical protein
MKFSNYFLFLWVIFVLLDPNLFCESGSRSRDPIESRYGSGSTTLLNMQKEIFFPNSIRIPQVNTDLKLLVVVDGLSNGPVYLPSIWERVGRER